MGWKIESSDGEVVFESRLMRERNARLDVVTSTHRDVKATGRADATATINRTAGWYRGAMQVYRRKRA